MTVRTSTGERGTSLLEVTFTVTLLLMLMAAVLQSYTSFAAAARKQDDAIAIRTTGRQAVAEVGAVLRSSTGATAASSSAEARQQVVVTRERFGGGSEVVRLRVDTSAGTLLRETLASPTGAVTATRILATGVVAGSSSFFRYYDSSGTELVPGVTDLATVAACTATWQVTIPIVPGTGRTAREFTTTVTTRNQRAEERSC